MNTSVSYEDYKQLITQNMKPVEDMPEVHELAAAMFNYVHLKMVEYEYDVEKKRELEFEKEQLSHAEQLLRAAAQKERENQRHLHQHHHNEFLDILVTVGTVAALGAVAVCAPALLANVIPMIGGVGSISNAIATGIAVGATDAAAQGAAIELGVKEKFSINEVLEAAVSAGVGTSAASLNVLPRTGLVAASVTGVQVAEIGLGVRDKIEIKDIGLQVAASVVASAINKAMPELVQTFGGGDAAKVAANAANTAINSVLQNRVNGTPINLANIAANVVGTISGSKIGKTIISANQEHVQTNEETNTTEANKIDFDKLCPINDKNYLEEQKYTPIEPSPTADEFITLLMNGKIAEAKSLAIDVEKTKYTPIGQNASVVENRSKWASAKTKDWNAIIKQSSEKAYQKHWNEINEITNNIANIDNPLERNKKITEAYNGIYESNHKLLWTKVAYYASMQVGDVISHANGVPVIGEYGATILGEGNKAVFQDIYPMLYYYEKYGLDELRSSLPAPDTSQQMILNALEEINKGDIDKGTDLMLEHEQRDILQRMYDDSKFSLLVKTNHLGNLFVNAENKAAQELYQISEKSMNPEMLKSAAATALVASVVSKVVQPEKVSIKVEHTGGEIHDMSDIDIRDLTQRMISARKFVNLVKESEMKKDKEKQDTSIKLKR